MEKIKGNEIEEWAKKYQEILTSTSDWVTCDETQIKILLNAETLDNKEDIKEMLEKKKLGFASVLYWRIKVCHSYKITISALLFLDCWMRNFGDSTMTANFLQFKAHNLNVKEIDVDILCKDIYPNGFLSLKSSEELWELQKVKRDRDNYSSDNLLDYRAAMKSIEL